MPTTNPSTLNPNPSPAALPYNPALSLWLSVDPLSDKYPNLSPYVYCANNPVVMKDPNGEDIWEVNEMGYSRCVEKSETEHKIYFTKGRSENAFGERITSGFGKNKSEVFIEHEKVDEFMGSFHPAGNGGHMSTFINDDGKEDLAKQFMKCVSKYNVVEWGYTGTKSGLRHISTSHTVGMDEVSAKIVEAISKEANLLFACHTQPNTCVASNDDWNAIENLNYPDATFGIIYNGKLFDFNGRAMDWSVLTRK